MVWSMLSVTKWTEPSDISKVVAAWMQTLKPARRLPIRRRLDVCFFRRIDEVIQRVAARCPIAIGKECG